MTNTKMCSYWTHLKVIKFKGRLVSIFSYHQKITEFLFMCDSLLLVEIEIIKK